MEDSWENYMDEEAKHLLERYQKEMAEGGLGFFDVDEYVILIDTLLLRSQLPEAVQLVRLARKQYPEAAELAIKQAELSMETGFCEQALALLEKVEEVEPYLYDLYIIRGHALKLLSRYEEAEQAFLQAKAKGAEPIDVAIGMADLKVARQQNAEAWKYLRQMIGTPQDTVETCNRFIDLVLKAGLHSEAIEFVRGIVKDNPYKTLYWKLLAELAEAAGDYGQALDAYEFVLAIQPDDHESMFGKFRNLSFVDTGNSPLPFYLQMEKEFQDLGDLIPIWCRIAQEYEVEEDWEKALSYYRRVLEFPETRAYALFRMGVIHNFYLDFKNALGLLRQALYESEALGNDTENVAKIYRGIARTYYYKGDAAQAMCYNRLAVDLNPEYRYHVYAYVLDACDLGEIPQALDYVEEALSQHPEDWLFLCKAFLYYYGGKREESYAFFQQAFCGSRQTLDDADVRMAGIYEDDARVLVLRNLYAPHFGEEEPEDLEPYIYYGPDEDYLRRAGLMGSEDEDNPETEAKGRE